MAEKIIEISNLSKSYKKNKAVDNISFSVKKGEIFAFLGPNGAGKSTTIKMMTTILKPDEGQIFVNSFDVAKDKDKVRKSFGIVFQDPSLDDELTAYENLDFHGVLYKMPKKLRRERIEELLKLVDLWDKKKNLVKTFSGGMKRRLEVARGLMHRPAVIFLDEPTLGLDPQTRNQMWNYVKKLNQEEGLSIFFTTHYLEEAEKMAQTIAIIDKGKIIAEGSNEKLKSDNNASSLEEVFLKLTGREIREEAAEPNSFHRMRRRMR